MADTARVQTPLLDIAYEHSGPPDGLPAVLLHGYPYDARAFDGVVPILNAAGIRTIVPYLRGFGATRFRQSETERSGQQAAIGQDLVDLLDGLQIERAVLAGFDWGSRAACIVSALWPDRVHGLLTCAGYQIQDIANSLRPDDPDQEYRLWYQYYFHTERGRRGLAERRKEVSRLLWTLWSPTWSFDDATFERTALSFDNPDFVDVVVHSYRHRMGNADGDPRYAEIEAKLSKLPKIGVPTIVLHGASDNVGPAAMSEDHGKYFTAAYERRVLPNVGHNPPQEAPTVFAESLLELCRP